MRKNGCHAAFLNRLNALLNNRSLLAGKTDQEIGAQLFFRKSGGMKIPDRLLKFRGSRLSIELISV